jgi:hypothetical protein
MLKKKTGRGSSIISEIKSYVLISATTQNGIKRLDLFSCLKQLKNKVYKIIKKLARTSKLSDKRYEK